MGLEAKVTEEVKNVFAADGIESIATYWTCGTFFVEGINYGEAQIVKHVIEEITEHVVLVSCLKPTYGEPWFEYAFDLTGEKL